MVMKKVLFISVYICESRRHGDIVYYYTVEFDGISYTLKYTNQIYTEDSDVPSFENMRIELVSSLKDDILKALEDRTQAVTSPTVQLINYPFDSLGVNLYDGSLMEAIAKGIDSL